MASEARRALIRMAANYGRLFTTVCLGLLLARVIFRGLGDEAWGLIALLGSTIGFAAMFQEVVNASLIRELGVAHHAGDALRFRTVYNSALAVTTGVAILSTTVMLALWLVLPLFQIPEALLWAARWMIVAKSVETLISILVAAPVNMYLVTERMVSYNIWLVLFRAAPIMSAVWLFVVQGISDPARGVTLYAFLSAALFIGFQLAAVAVILVRDRRLLPAPGAVRRESVREILRLGGWNVAALTSMNLHVRTDNLIMNLFFGLFGNVIFGLTTQLTSYVRMLTTGVTFGVDAVSARLSSTEGATVQQLFYHSTRLSAIVAFPAAVGLWLLAGPILTIWVGDRMQQPLETIPPTVTLMRIMCVGMACRAVADGWTLVLYGAGHVARYAPLVLAGGVANPILAVLLIIVLPEKIAYTGAVLSYSTIFVVVHMGLLPRLAARLLEVRLSALLAPMVRPLIVALACAPILIVAAQTLESWSLLRLALVAGAYGVAYVALTYLLVFDRREQQRIAMALRRLPRAAIDGAGEGGGGSDAGRENP